MLREWVSERVSRFTNDHQRNRSTEPKNREKPQKVEVEIAQKSVETDRVMTPIQASYVQCLITNRMRAFVNRDHMSDEYRDTEPCSICFTRYSSIRCDPCTHGRVCKYCAYQMLKAAGYPVYQSVICTQCYQLIEGFTRWSKEDERKEDEEETKENSGSTSTTTTTTTTSGDDDNEVEHTVSLKDYAWQMYNDQMKLYRDNEAFEHST